MDIKRVQDRGKERERKGEGNRSCLDASNYSTNTYKGYGGLGIYGMLFTDG